MYLDQSSMKYESLSSGENFCGDIDPISERTLLAWLKVFECMNEELSAKLAVAMGEQFPLNLNKLRSQHKPEPAAGHNRRACWYIAFRISSPHCFHLPLILTSRR